MFFSFVCFCFKLLFPCFLNVFFVGVGFLMFFVSVFICICLFGFSSVLVVLKFVVVF